MTHANIIRTSVSPEAIDKVTRLFNGTEADILAELFQNARRAGATRIDVTHFAENGINWTVVSDNGCGIANPARLLALGASSWSQELSKREDPAGMGLYSCAGRATRISSSTGAAGFKLHIPANGWTGNTDIHVEPHARARGTSISFALPETAPPTSPGIIERAARYLPVAVYHDGTQLPRRDFLDGADLILNVMGTRAGVYSNDPHHFEPTVNFHGVTLNHKLPSVREVFHRKWSLKIDIEDASALQLVLPARKELVENAFLNEIEAAWKSAIFTAIARQPKHSLAHLEWNKALVAGVELAPATPMLRPWEALQAIQTMRPDTTPEALPDNAAILDVTDACSGQMIARAIALSPERQLPVFMWPDRDFAGYGWYDALPVYSLKSCEIKIKDKTEIINANSDTICSISRPDAIDIILECGDDTLTLSTDVYLADPEYCGLDPGLLDVAVTTNSTIDPAALADLIERAAFCPSDDSDSDSWDRQQSDFQMAAMERAYAILEGDTAAQLARIRAEFDAHVRWHIPHGQGLTLVFDGTTLTTSFQEAEPQTSQEAVNA